MDWVKNNSSGKKSKHRKSIDKNLDESASKTTQQTASDWFAELSQENLERLQQTFQGTAAPGKKSKQTLPVSSIGALTWGIHGLPSEDFGDNAQLLAFVEAQSLSHVSKEYDTTSQSLAAWLGQQLPRCSEEPAVALCAVAWIYGLPRAGRALEASEWLETLQSILAQVDRSWAQEDPESLLAWLIWACEIPLALATQLSQLGGRDRVVSGTLDRLAACLEAAMEKPDPWIESGGVYLRALLSSVIRCRWSADQIGARRWYGPQRKAMTKLAMIALAATDGQGKPLMQDASLGSADTAFWQSLLLTCGSPEKLGRALTLVLPKTLVPDEAFKIVKELEAASKVHRASSKRENKAKSKSKSDKNLVTKIGELGFHSEGAEFALMRSKWDRSGCRMAIHYGADPMWIDVVDRHEQRLMSGWWEVAVTKNGKPLDVDCGWSEVCWFSDDDVDYLELQCEVDGQCTIQRQALLVRDDGLCFFADTLIGNEEAEWELETRFPLESGIHFQQEKSTRDGMLFLDDDEQERAWVYPLAMPEWKRTPFHGDLLQEGDCLTLVQKAQGRKLYSPLAMTLHRHAKDAGQTWRQLTVAEDLRIVGKEVAAAFRIQAGKSHWVMYRSLAPTTRRTAIGLHINSEFYACRFHRKTGEIETLVEVDAEASS